MRVIAGKSKGHNLKSLSGSEVRPTIDRVKEALFNILGPEIIDIDFLDLYAGFGGLGIEALSRGAASSTFIDNSSRQVGIIKENLNLTGLEKQAEVIEGDVLTQLGRFKPESFDIIVMDPPYQAGLMEPTIEKIMQYDLLKEAGIISVEHHKKDEIRIKSNNLELIRERDYGNIRLSLYMKGE